MSTHPTEAQDVHTYMGLSYSSYLVIPRVMAEQMPMDWQHQFTALAEQLHEAYRHVDHPDGYEVKPGTWCYVNEVPDATKRALGITHSTDNVPDLPENPTDKQFEEHEAAYREAEDEDLYWDRDGKELSPHEYVFVPGSDPYPRYRYPGNFGPRFKSQP